MLLRDHRLFLQGLRSALLTGALLFGSGCASIMVLERMDAHSDTSELEAIPQLAALPDGKLELTVGAVWRQRGTTKSDQGAARKFPLRPVGQIYQLDPVELEAVIRRHAVAGTINDVYLQLRPNKGGGVVLIAKVNQKKESLRLTPVAAADPDGIPIPLGYSYDLRDYVGAPIAERTILSTIPFQTIHHDRHVDAGLWAIMLVPAIAVDATTSPFQVWFFVKASRAYNF